MKVAVLDDYQGVAKEMADWSQLPEGTHIEFFTDHLTGEDALADRLKEFDAMKSTINPVTILEFSKPKNLPNEFLADFFTSWPLSVTPTI